MSQITLPAIVPGSQTLDQDYKLTDSTKLIKDPLANRTLKVIWLDTQYIVHTSQSQTVYNVTTNIYIRIKIIKALLQPLLELVRIRYVYTRQHLGLYMSTLA